MQIGYPLLAGGRHVQTFYSLVEMHRDAIPEERRTVDRFETHAVATFSARQFLLKLELFPNNGEDRYDTLALDLKLAK